MNDGQRTAYPGRGVPELQAVLLAVAVVVVGPPALILGALLAELAGRWRSFWLWTLCIPALVAAVVLWPFSRRHILAAATAVHDAHSYGDPKQVALAVWPQLWPVWLAALMIAPLIALALLNRRRDSLDPQRTEQPRTAARAARLERRSVQRAESERERTGDALALFLGYKLGGDDLLPTRRGRVTLPLSRLGHHLVVAGATGSGKTETVLRLAYSLAATSDWRVVYIDGKGDRETQQRFAALMAHAGRGVSLFPQQRYDGWRGSDEEIANRLLQLIDFAAEGGGTYYRDLAVSAVRLACCTPDGPPRSSTELLRRLSQRALTTLHAGRPQAGDAAVLRPEDLDAIRARYAAFFATVGDLLDGSLNLDQTDSAYFLLDGLRLKYEAGYLARFLIEEFTQWAVARKPRGQRVLLVVDEFSALAQASEGLVHVVERTRGFGVAAALCPQVAEGMGSPEAAARIIGSTQTILLHATAYPEQLIGVGGTRRVYEFAHQLDHDAVTGVGSARLQHEYRAAPDEVRRLKVGQCFAIGSGLAMKLQIAAAPNLTGANRQPSQPADADADLQAR